MQFVNYLQGFSIDPDKFDYEKYNDVNDKDCDSAKYIIIPDIKTSQNALCKIYNPKILTKGRNKDSKDKAGQSWYAQLQILRESFLLRELNHPAIIKYVGLNLYNDHIQFSDDDDIEEEEEEGEKIRTSPTLFLEYAGKKSIQCMIKKDGKLDLKLFTPVKRQICIIGITAAVKYLHDNNIVHRNLSPVSIWLDKNLYPKIFDFSNSREVKEDESNNTSVTNNMSKHISYQAPEQFNGTIDYDFLDMIDIFSLGRLLYLMLTGNEPFHGINNFNIMEAAANGIFPEIQFPKIESKYWKTESNNWKAEYYNWKILLESCWSVNPSDRPKASEVYDFVTNKIFRIRSNFNESEKNEISTYIKTIKESENKIKKYAQLTLSKAGEFHFEDHDETIKQKFSELDQLLNNNTVEENKNRFLDLVTYVFADLDSVEIFFENNYLPKVMKYINMLLAGNFSNNYSAQSFINKAFGEPVSNNNEDHLKIGDISKEIKVLNVSSKVTKICSHAFSGYDQLERVFIPNSVKIIEDGAFSKCKQLKYVYLPKSIEGENLGEGVFKNCPKLNDVIMPEGLKKIKKSTFRGDKKLKNIILNNGLLNIDEKAFSECVSLESIKIPESVISIGPKAFQLCKELEREKIEFPGASSLQIFSIKHGLMYSAKKK